jgi:flagellar motor switch protein FliN/FliY
MSVNRRSDGSAADLVRFMEDEFVRAASASLTALLGAQVQINSVTSSDVQNTDLWFSLQFQQFAKAPMFIGSSREALLALGKEATALAELTNPTEADAIAAVADAWSEVASSMAASITARSKQNVSAELVQALTAKPLDMPAEHVIAFELRLPNSQLASFQLVIHPNLVKAVLALDSIAAPQATSAMNTKNLDLLLDVEMPVSVSFGRAQLPLKDVMKLTTGSIVELSRSVSEPVDIIVNNFVIARGEVVVVEGNFGVRIKEISSKQERLKSLS